MNKLVSRVGFQTASDDNFQVDNYNSGFVNGSDVEVTAMRRNGNERRLYEATVSQLDAERKTFLDTLRGKKMLMEKKQQQYQWKLRQIQSYLTTHPGSESVMTSRPHTSRVSPRRYSRSPGFASARFSRSSMPLLSFSASPLPDDQTSDEKSRRSPLVTQPFGQSSLHISDADHDTEQQSGVMKSQKSNSRLTSPNTTSRRPHPHPLTLHSSTSTSNFDNHSKSSPNFPAEVFDFSTNSDGTMVKHTVLPQRILLRSQLVPQFQVKDAIRLQEMTQVVQLMRDRSSHNMLASSSGTRRRASRASGSDLHGRSIGSAMIPGSWYKSSPTGSPPAAFIMSSLSMPNFEEHVRSQANLQSSSTVTTSGTGMRIRPLTARMCQAVQLEWQKEAKFKRVASNPKVVAP